MNRYYFTFPANKQRIKYYVVITAESQEIAKDVFRLMYHSDYTEIYVNHFIAGKEYLLFDTITQRATQ